MNSRRESFNRIAETCPKVDAAIAEALRKVIDEIADESTWINATDAAAEAAKQYGAIPLRDALVECEQERLTAEERVEELEAQVESQQTEIERLAADKEELERRVDQLEGQLEERGERNT